LVGAGPDEVDDLSEMRIESGVVLAEGIEAE
jgi:hypothetical protein